MHIPIYTCMHRIHCIFIFYIYIYIGSMAESDAGDARKIREPKGWGLKQVWL